MPLGNEDVIPTLLNDEDEGNCMLYRHCDNVMHPDSNYTYVPVLGNLLAFFSSVTQSLKKCFFKSCCTHFRIKSSKDLAKIRPLTTSSSWSIIGQVLVNSHNNKSTPVIY